MTDVNMSGGSTEAPVTPPMTEPVLPPPVEIPPLKVEWPASKNLGLPEFSLEIPNRLGSGLLVVYRTPALGDMGGYRYEAFYNQTEIEQRPGCEAEDMIELIRIRISAGYGMENAGMPGVMTQVVEYKHPDIDYAIPVTGDITAPEGE